MYTGNSASLLWLFCAHENTCALITWSNRTYRVLSEWCGALIKYPQQRNVWFMSDKSFFLLLWVNLCSPPSEWEKHFCREHFASNPKSRYSAQTQDHKSQQKLNFILGFHWRLVLSVDILIAQEKTWEFTSSEHCIKLSSTKRISCWTFNCI